MWEQRVLLASLQQKYSGISNLKYNKKKFKYEKNIFK